jgi:hypothetical protein
MNFHTHTAKTQYQKSPHLRDCERFIHSHDRSAYPAAGKYADKSWEYV